MRRCHGSVERTVLKLNNYIDFIRRMLKMRVRYLAKLLDAILEYLLTRLSYRQSKELTKRDQERVSGTTSWFTPDEVNLMGVLADLIVPPNEESPASQDADVVNTIERLVINSSKKKLYSLGLYSFDEWARLKYNEPFIKLSQENQMNLLKIIDPKCRGSYVSNSLKRRFKRKFRIIPYFRRGLFPAVAFFPVLVGDVIQAFYTSEVSWLWLGYDGPPMPEGYPNLTKRRTEPIEPDTLDVGTATGKLKKTLKILVCLKQVSDKDSLYTIDNQGAWINEKDLNYKTNESDLYALEEALRIKSKVGGEVTVLSVGEKRVLKCLKDGLAKGADRAIHLDDHGFNNVDAFVTAKAIAAVIKNMDFDIVFTGVESSDFALGQTGIILSELMGMAYATMTVSIDISENLKTAQVKRELEGNTLERVEVSLPAVLTIQTGLNEPRYTTLQGILQARNKEIRILSSNEIGLGSSELGGQQGSKIKHIRFYIPEKKKNTIMLDGSPREIAEKLIANLHKDVRI